jgi:hypothetical protein
MPPLPPRFQVHSVWDDLSVAKQVRDRIAKYGIQSEVRVRGSYLWEILVSERDVVSVRMEIRYIARKRSPQAADMGIVLGTNGFFSVQVDGGKVYKARMASHPVRVVINKQAG